MCQFWGSVQPGPPQAQLGSIPCYGIQSTQRALRPASTRPAGSPPAKAVTVTPRGLAARHALAAGGDAADTPPGRLQLASQPRTSPASSIQSPTPRTPTQARPPGLS